MSAMQQPTTDQPTRDYPRTPDGKYKYTAWDGSPRHYKQVKMPGVAKGPILPESVSEFFRKRFRRTDTPASH
jgi:hypothetical protein